MAWLAAITLAMGPAVAQPTLAQADPPDGVRDGSVTYAAGVYMSDTDFTKVVTDVGAVKDFLIQQSLPSSTSAAAVTTIQQDVWVLAGDSLTSLIGLVHTSNSTAVPEAERRWVPQAQYIEIGVQRGSTYTILGPAADDPDNYVDMSEWPVPNAAGTNCAVDPPSLRPVGVGNYTVWDAYCFGVGVAQLKLSDLQPVPLEDQSEEYPKDPALPTSVLFQEVYQGVTTDITWGGSEHPVVGSQGTTFFNINVLAPQLQVVKQVCSTGTGCDPAADPATVDMIGQRDTAGVWVDTQKIAYASETVQWRITAFNTGNVPLTNIHVAEDALSAVEAADRTALGENQCVDDRFPDDLVLAPGESADITCDTKLTRALVGDVINTVSLNADFPIPTDSRTGKPATYPDGTDLLSRFTGNADEPNMVPSKEDDARVNEAPAEPRLKLTKWVCDDPAGCAVPQPGSPELAQLAGVGARDPMTGAYAVLAGAPALGWEKETRVAYGASADWLVVVTNTGNIDITNVVVEDYADGAADDPVVKPGSSLQLGTLAPGQSATVALASAHVTDLDRYVSGVDDSVAIEPEFGEPTYRVGQDVVNTATASGTATVGDSSPQNVTSNESQAEVGANPTPELTLTKWVCALGTECDDPTAAELAQLGAGTPTAQWVKDATVPYGTDADWLIVVTNTGDVNLINVTLTREDLSLGEHGDTTGCQVGQVVADKLVVDEAAFVRCTTKDITDRGTQVPGPDTGTDVVNLARAGGTPVDDNDKPLPKLDEDDNPTDEPGEPIESNEDDAEVNTNPTPELLLTKWVCVLGTECADPTTAELAQLGAGTPTAQWVKDATVPYGTDADWLIVVTNTGDINLINVTLTREDLSLGGHGDTTGCLVGQVVADRLVVDGVASVRCTTKDITDTGTQVPGPDTGTDVVNIAQAEGTPADDEDKPLPKLDEEGNPTDEPVEPIVTEPDDAEVNTKVPNPGLSLTKWVCVLGTECADPTTAELAELGAGTPTTQWVKDATVPYGADADWLLVVSNTGDVNLINVTLTREDLSLGGHGDTTGCQAGQVVADKLVVDGVAFVRCTTKDITDTGTQVPGSDTGTDVVNIARAEATPVDDEDKPLPKVDEEGNPTEEPAEPIESNEDDAEVNTEVPNPSLELTKWVCFSSTAERCTDPTPAELSQLAQGTAAGPWVKDATIANGDTAYWLIVVVNTGNTVLANVVLSLDELTGGDHGAMTGCAEGTVVSDRLAPEEADFVRCSTAAVTNTGTQVPGQDTGTDLVNTAQAEATPVDDENNPIDEPIESNPDDAEVTTEIVLPENPEPEPEPKTPADNPPKEVPTGGLGTLPNPGWPGLLALLAGFAAIAGVSERWVRRNDN